MNDLPAEIRVVRAEGSPHERGRQIGRALGDLIERSIGFYIAYLERRGIASRDLQDFLAPYFFAAEDRLPAYADMVKAMAEGAMVPVWEPFAVNAFDELEALLISDADQTSFLQRKAGQAVPVRASRSPLDRYTSFALAGPGYTLLGHNEQWLAGDQGNVAVVVEIPEDGTPVVAAPSVVCCLPAVGMNEFGGAQGIQSLVAADDGVGVPRVMVSRHSLEASDRMDAVRRASLEGRAGGYGHVFAFAGGDTFIVETTAERASLLERPGPHTNHYLDPELADLAPEPSEGSTARYERILTLLDERDPTTVLEVMDILADHGSTPQSICLHPDESLGDEAAAVMFSMVCDLEERRMWVAPGNPCSKPFEEIDLADAIPRP